MMSVAGVHPERSFALVIFEKEVLAIDVMQQLTGIQPTDNCYGLHPYITGTQMIVLHAVYTSSGCRTSVRLFSV